MNKTISPDQRAAKASPAAKKYSMVITSVPRGTKATPERHSRERVEALLARRASWLFVLFVIIGSARIVATYNIFSHTYDEPAHIACGMEWLSKGQYSYEAQHPPLARVMTALLPYLFGAHSMGHPTMWAEGAAILSANPYDKTLALARLGILPFFWLAAWVVYQWSKRTLGELTALFATFLFTFLPPVLAHSGLATTDMALTATFGAAFLTMLIWMQTPTWKWSVLFGISLAAAVLSKFSVLAFFPSAAVVALLVYFVIERPTPGFILEFVRTRSLRFAVALGVALMLIWAGYRFSFVNNVPAPELFKGIQDVMQHNAEGHPSYLLGKNGNTGWWYFYLVDLTFKTPLALLVLLVVGMVECWKNRRTPGGRYWIPAAFALGILIFASLFSRINIGVRHVLPMYFGFCIIAAAGAGRLWSAKSAAAQWILAALLFWMATTSILSHPDYLPYFNQLAGDQPEKILVESDLDWGQDLKRLLARLHQLGATDANIQVHGYALTRPLNPEAPAPGWNAVSLTVLKVTRMGLGEMKPEFDPWPNWTQPTERVGKSILLYYFRPAR